MLVNSCWLLINIVFVYCRSSNNWNRTRCRHHGTWNRSRTHTLSHRQLEWSCDVTSGSRNDFGWWPESNICNTPYARSVSLLRATINVHLEPGLLAGSLGSPEGRLGAHENNKISIGTVRCSELLANRWAAQAEGQTSRGDADLWRSLQARWKEFCLLGKSTNLSEERNAFIVRVEE
jgi:hypothetical protein